MLKKGLAGLEPLLRRHALDVPRNLKVSTVEPPKRSASAQGAGLYVEGEVPNRVIHQQHGTEPKPIRGDHFDLEQDAHESRTIPPFRGGVSSSDYTALKPNFRGDQFRASGRIPKGWELRQDGPEVGGTQSAGHYSFRATQRGKTLKEAGEANFKLFNEKIGNVKKNRAPFVPLEGREPQERPMGTAWRSTVGPDTRRASSTTRQVSLAQSESSAQTHFRSPKL
ncbi:MAG: hypothetical protein JNM52_05990 [Betaproteobacteria bacterium]|nr:hypothetical protein [Betaproteobacteria bacterium]